MRRLLSKLLVAAALLLAAADLVVLVYKAGRGGASSAAAAPKVPAPGMDRVVVYYLYGNIRCVTCKSMEAMTAKALKAGFQKEIERGALAFKVENYQAQGNERFIKEFGVVAASVVLVEEKAGKVVRWKNLEKIWDLTESQEEFGRYIRSETAAFLAGDKAGPVMDASASASGSSSWKELLLALAAAFGLGILTAISPCPLTTNIAAISFLGRQASSPRRVLASGVLYSLGRIMAYVALGAILVAGLLSAPGVSSFLSRHMNNLLGPVLVVSGLFILGLLDVHMGMLVPAGKLQGWAEKGGALTSFLLGVVFALAFCPTSAALFFGGLVPLAIKNSSPVFLPVAYGLATGLPVMLFAFVVALASNAVGRVFDSVVQVEKWTRRGAGALFIGVGVYYSIVFVFLSGW